MLDAEQIQALKPMEVCLMGSIPVKWKHSSLILNSSRGSLSTSVDRFTLILGSTETGIHTVRYRVS